MEANGSRRTATSRSRSITASSAPRRWRRSPLHHRGGVADGVVDSSGPAPLRRLDGIVPRDYGASPMLDLGWRAPR